ncbi:MAG: hypothetical protein D3922_08490 [Candidatus Electrothrix sp. AR1]|nr:hypothetical protein [Candidatus Electrothrix sp. AR1]
MKTGSENDTGVKQDLGFLLIFLVLLVKLAARHLPDWANPQGLGGKRGDFYPCLPVLIIKICLIDNGGPGFLTENLDELFFSLMKEQDSRIIFNPDAYQVWLRNRGQIAMIQVVDMKAFIFGIWWSEHVLFCIF